MLIICFNCTNPIRLSFMFGIFKPAPHLPSKPQDQVDNDYKKLRWQVFIGIFVGYAGYYLVRKKFLISHAFFN